MKRISRSEQTFPLIDVALFKRKAWRWAQSFDYCSILENNSVKYPYNSFQNLLGVGNSSPFFSFSLSSLDDLSALIEKSGDWLLGYLSYNLKNEIEPTLKRNLSKKVPQTFSMFIPEHILFFNESNVTISSVADPTDLFEEINRLTDYELSSVCKSEQWQTVAKSKYADNVGKLKQHIIEGDIYEVNYCIEFFSKTAQIDPLDTFLKLIDKSPMPFSFFYKFKNEYILCSSPERFLKKEENKLISQPIKGTIKRGKDHKEDNELKERLKNSEKERAENLMIVDLVRNDLAKSSVPGSVIVEELFGIYTFNQLHQMISTITAEKKDKLTLLDAIKNAFPMGSMTGAPKIRAMELIDTYEASARGAFSGAGGYISPEGDFDFNVIIRSLFYNSLTGHLSFQAGSAITYDSDPEYEYEECLLKAQAIFEVLGISKEDLVYSEK